MPKKSSNKSDDENETLGNLEQSSSPPDTQPEVSDRVPVEGDEESSIGVYAAPEDTSEKEIDEEELREFLEMKGAVEILAQLADEPKQFSKIDDALVVSHGTIATRLTDGAKLGLWREYMIYPDDGGKIKLYQLTPEARPFAEIAQDENISDTTEQLKQANKQHTDAISNFHDKAFTNTDE
jgi:DNA-binding HxlR family transcriptional regulator